MSKVQADAFKDEYIQNAFGYRRPLPQIRSSVWKEKIGAYRIAVNTPIQGTASLIMGLGIANARRRLDPERAKLVMTVHDSVVFEVRNDYVEESMPIIKECLENPIFQGKTIPFLTVPLLAEFEIGQKYGSLKSVDVKLPKK